MVMIILETGGTVSLPGAELIRLAKLDCQAVSPAGAVTGPPILLIHGLGGGIWGWDNFQSHFAQRGYRSYAVELPGHGERPDPRDREAVGISSVETYALYVAAVAAELGPCVVIGHSLGGLVAQKLAETQSQVGFIFLASAPPWHMFRRDYWSLWKHLLRHPWSELIAPVIGCTMLMDRSLQDELVNNRIRPECRPQIYGCDVPDSGRASMQMMAGLVSVAEHRITSPCLVVGGWADRLIPPAEQRRLATKYHCALQMYDRGHMLTIEDGWEEVADGLLGWVQSLSQAEPAHEREWRQLGGALSASGRTLPSDQRERPGQKVASH